MLYLISYDLKTPGQNYNKIIETIKSAEGWAHALESTWVINTGFNIQYWTDRLRAATDPNDLFIIADITMSERNGWLPQNIWDWIRQQR